MSSVPIPAFARSILSWLGGKTASQTAARGATSLLSLFGLDQGLTSFHVDWHGWQLALPFLVVVWLFGWMLLEFSLYLSHQSPRRPSLGAAICVHAEALRAGKKWIPLRDLRNRLTRTLHLMELDAERVQLGAAALEAAISLEDKVTEAEIRIDDLGWTKHEVHKDSQAASSIALGISILEQLKGPTHAEEVRRLLLIAKGRRHLCKVMPPADPVSHYLAIETDVEAAAALAQSAGVADAVGIEVDTERAQIHYAISKAIARRHGVHESGSVSSDNVSALAEVTGALDRALRAEALLTRVGDAERLAKNLKLNERLLLALGRGHEAQKVRIRLDRVLESSSVAPDASYLSDGD